MTAEGQAYAVIINRKSIILCAGATFIFKERNCLINLLYESLINVRMYYSVPIIQTGNLILIFIRSSQSN